jgi:hypothetical protein
MQMAHHCSVAKMTRFAIPAIWFVRTIKGPRVNRNPFGGDYPVETACPVTLIFKTPVTDFA